MVAILQYLLLPLLPLMLITVKIVVAMVAMVAMQFGAIATSETPINKGLTAWW